ncbi:hypothetical protein [Sporisorium scitamineum]|uniref:Uncharacterized protein n=1 Tax=Sporisorium scitamineum TaxID=49012 RepID=A0A0F7SB95_9BASI|nr:hypothetical protein [Sporisorium scitamineum]
MQTVFAEILRDSTAPFTSEQLNTLPMLLWNNSFNLTLPNCNGSIATKSPDWCLRATMSLKCLLMVAATTSA